MPANSLELLVSSISVTVERGNTLERQSSVQVLSRLASSAKLFRSADGRFCAQVPVGDRLEIYGLKSAAFRDWLIDGFLIDQPEPPSNWATRRVVGMLEARARFNTGIPEVFIRIGQDGDGGDSPYFLDLVDPSGRGPSRFAILTINNDNRKEATEKVLDDSPLASVLLTAARQGINWSGTPLELFRTVSKIADIAARTGWPKTIHTHSATNCAASLPKGKTADLDRSAKAGMPCCPTLLSWDIPLDRPMTVVDDKP
jgi:hypothetical protein